MASENCRVTQSQNAIGGPVVVSARCREAIPKSELDFFLEEFGCDQLGSFSIGLTRYDDCSFGVQNTEQCKKAQAKCLPD